MLTSSHGRLGRRWEIGIFYSVSMCLDWMPSRRIPLEHNSQLIPAQLRIDLHDYDFVTDVVHDPGVTTVFSKNFRSPLRYELVQRKLRWAALELCVFSHRHSAPMDDQSMTKQVYGRISVTETPRKTSRNVL